SGSKPIWPTCPRCGTNNSRWRSDMNTNRTTAALELALQVLAAIEDAEVFLPGDPGMPSTTQDIRDQLEGPLSALKQQPIQITGADLYVRLHREVQAAGSETALAERIDIKRQSLSDVLTGRREPGPAILGYLGLKRVTTTQYEHAEPVPKTEPK